MRSWTWGLRFLVKVHHIRNTSTNSLSKQKNMADATPQSAGDWWINMSVQVRSVFPTNEELSAIRYHPCPGAVTPLSFWEQSYFQPLCDIHLFNLPASLILLFKAQRWNPAILSSAEAQYLPAALISRQVLVEAEYSTCSHREGAYLFHITQAEHFESSPEDREYGFSLLRAQNSNPAWVTSQAKASHIPPVLLQNSCQRDIRTVGRE